MRRLSCSDSRAAAPELALGVLSGSERDSVLSHMAACAPCRAVVSELTEAADVLTTWAPEVEPPTGFEDRVLATLSRRRRSGSRRRVFALVAATAAAVAIVSIATVRVVDRGRNDGGSVAATQVDVVRMVGNSGADVGWAFVSDGEPASVGVSVAYGIPNGAYEVWLRGRAGDGAVIGRVEIADGRGAWAGTASLSDGAPESIALVGGDGQVVCEGVLAG